MDNYDDYCDTELCLSPGGAVAARRHLHPTSNSNTTTTTTTTTINSGSLYKMMDKSEGNNQQITIFYGGRMCTCDVTEIQARAIICMAKRDMEERMARCNNNKAGDSSSEPSTQPPQLINPGLSMKRSLHHFLEKRKARISPP
ncbi:protein TIFY 5A-like [Dioscorea cayenensis subsp. rotundata]|uniref:Protein TIFY n=1 Tax=Dioscorea cayennensis subsp. rotundata TaxID=55577 RepID=A0AB40AK15_DIOCR|nr:protein TIFY 5A-like [Dioscorea cayenensis subsp. rotundata]